MLNKSNRSVKYNYHDLYLDLLVSVPENPEWDFWSWFESGQWETTTVEAANAILKPGDLMFDIGAWHGPLTLLQASRGVKVVAIEPDPLAFEILSDNILLNRLESLVSAKQLALSNKVEIASLHLSGAGGNAYSSLTRLLPNSISVVTTVLSELFADFGIPDLIKMDIEGGESRVLASDGSLLRSLEIPMLLALHPDWYDPRCKQAFERELACWELTDLHNNMYLARPK